MAKKKQKNGLYYYCCGILLGIITVAIFFTSYYTFLIPQTNQTTSLFTQSFLTSGPRKIQIPILIYHYVEYVKDPRDTIRKSLDIIPPIFEAQVATLKDSGYTFLTPIDINLVLEGRRTLPKKPVILSFDDGYEDFYTDVMPILIKYKVKAVQYVISDFVDTPNYLKTKQVFDIKKSGLIEIACHTMHHPALAKSSLSDAIHEIGGCKKQMLEKFGVHAVSFAYPYGSYDPFLFPILKNAGFKNATTTEPGTEISGSNIYNIPRLRPGIRIGAELTSYIENEVNIAKNPNPIVESVNASENHAGE